VEGLHAVGDIHTKVSVNCVINLHTTLLFMCLFLWVYLVCGLKLSVYLWAFPIYVSCICLLPF
jgi:hypothetical protein